MTIEKFKEIAKEFEAMEKSILQFKADDYTNNKDRLLNFKEVAAFLGMRPSEVALAYLLKHIQSIALAVRKNEYKWVWDEDGKEGLKQRIADARNYLLLLAACIDEEITKKNSDTQRRLDSQIDDLHISDKVRTDAGVLAGYHVPA